MESADVGKLAVRGGSQPRDNAAEPQYPLAKRRGFVTSA